MGWLQDYTGMEDFVHTVAGAPWLLSSGILVLKEERVHLANAIILFPVFPALLLDGLG